MHRAARFHRSTDKQWMRIGRRADRLREQPVVQEGEEICAHSDTYGFDQCRSGLEHEFDMR